MGPEKNPPGDIPDTQAFIKYAAPTGGYTLQVPEGWARQTSGTSVSFVDQLHGVSVTTAGQAAAPTVSSVSASQIPALKASSRAVEVMGVKSMHTKHGPAIFQFFVAEKGRGWLTTSVEKLRMNRRQTSS